MKKIVLMIIMVFLIACANQQPKLQNPSVSQFTLDNGLKVLFLPREKEGLEMRLIVHSGSLQEDEQQLGLAHFVEHMAFKGTQHFPNKSSFKQLEKYGIQLGSHINAVTSFNTTTYKLSLPDNEKAINLGLRVLSDWAYHISFNQQDYDSERDVIIEEWRLRQGVAYRINSQLDDLRYQGSLYATRSPIGDLSIIKNGPIESAKQFYSQWYQSQRMSVVIVGSFDQKSMKKAIEKLFGQQPKGKTPPDIPELRNYKHYTSPLIEMIFDPEQGQRMIQVMLQKNLKKSLNTQLDFKDDIVDQLWLYILNQRFSLLVENQKIQALQGQEKSVLLDQQRQQYTFFAIPIQDNYLQAMQVLFNELQRMATVPVSDAELQEAKDNIIRKLAQQAQSEDNYSNAYQADQITTALQYQLPIISKKQQLYFTKTIFNRIDASQLKKAVAERLADSELRLAVIGPETDKHKITKQQIQLTWNESRSNHQLSDFPFHKKEIQLDITPLKEGHIKETQLINSINSERLILSNGMQVILHQDKNLTDNVQIKVRVPGGQSIDDKNQIGLTAWSQNIANASTNELVNMSQLKQRQIDLVPYTELLFHGYEGSAPQNELETLFKLLYMKIVTPKFDENKFSLVKQNAQLSQNHQPIERHFLDFIHQKSFNHSERLIVDPKGTWNSFTLSQLEKQYQRLYASPKDTIVVITGNFDREKINQLVKTWLATIPEGDKLQSVTNWKDNQITPINRPLQLDYPYGTSNKTMVSIIYSTNAKWQYTDQLALSLLDYIINLRLRTIIREQHSGVYTIVFSEQLIKKPNAYYLARLNFTTDPKRANEIAQLVNETMDNIRRYGVNSEELAQAKQAWQVNYNQMIKSAQYWSNSIAQIATDDQDFTQITQQKQLVQSLTIDHVNELAQQFIGKNLKQFRLLPKATNTQ